MCGQVPSGQVNLDQVKLGLDRSTLVWTGKVKLKKVKSDGSSRKFLGQKLIGLKNFLDPKFFALKICFIGLRLRLKFSLAG